MIRWRQSPTLLSQITSLEVDERSDDDDDELLIASRSVTTY
jgi:hypothetical protein